MKDNFEIVLDDLRLYPDSRISAIIRRLDIGKSSIKYALYRLVQIGKVKKFKYGPSDFGYSEVAEVSMPIKDVPGYRKEKIRFEARFRPVISDYLSKNATLKNPKLKFLATVH